MKLNPTAFDECLTAPRDRSAGAVLSGVGAAAIGGPVEAETLSRIKVPFVIKGSVINGADPAVAPVPPARWTPAALDLDSLVWPGHEPPPLFDVRTADIIEMLSGFGAYLKDDPGGHLKTAMERLVDICGASRPVVERAYANLWRSFDADSLRFQVDQELGGEQFIDGWCDVELPDHSSARIRAFPASTVHIMAGNAPGLAAHTIARSALSKGTHLLKLASNDVFTAPALLRSLADMAPGNPISRSFSAVYWRGGNEEIESVLLRPVFFSKLVVWGGTQAVNGVAKYVGPGIELISFDPKTSISLIGPEAFASDATLRAVAAAAATDATLHNQDACNASRVQFIQGSPDEADRFCEYLVGELGVEREKAACRSNPVPNDIRLEIDALRNLAPFYRVWGRTDGTGMVIRSDEPVSFYPTGRVVNVVAVESLDDAIDHVNVATQTVGVYPPALRLRYRDALCHAGAQRITSLGSAGSSWLGLPHDGFYPLARLVRWVKDEA
jgi:Acyl-CoA reductase (LuxC)